MSSETIFSKIIRKEIPAKIVYESETVLAFRDIDPKAPTHILIIPKKVIKDVGAAGKEDQAVLGELLLVAGELAKKEGLTERGYRLVINAGEDAGQSVAHLHLHLIGGRKLGWPPG
jgi:histidine triad (HIT) family protein